ncbi:MAG: TolC family protein [Candidatus Hydrogenedentes bacterium]|nr:TolC family protein [Candidatus Hydrogenedentota bacterium]
MRISLYLFIVLLASVGAQSDTTPITDLDQLLENVAPILNESGAYRNSVETDEDLSPLALDLDRCVEIAVAQNAQILVAETEVALREAQAGQARARRKPKVNVQWSYRYIDKLNQDIGPPAIQRVLGVQNYAPDKGTITTGLSVTQVLYTGGQIQAAVKASQYLATSEAWREEAIREEVAYQAKTAYHDALLAHALVNVATEALSVFERHQQDTETLKEEGMVTPFEVLRAKTEVGARQANLTSAEAAARLADLNIRRILALPGGQPITYDRHLPREAITDSVTDLKARAQKQRAELKALTDALAAGKQQARGVKGKYLPQAAASANWINVDKGGQVLPDGWQFNVGAQWDLYLGGQRKHELGEARARISGLRIQQADMERLIALDVEQAVIALHKATVTMGTEKEHVALAKESVRLAKLRYQEGIGTQTEIIDSALVHTQAKTSLVQAIRDYYVAYASLERALGA